MRGVLILALALVAAAPSDPEAQIRAVRAENNAALARHDTVAERRAYVPGYTLIRGFAGTVVEGADRVAADLEATDLKDPTYIAYHRTPDRIRIASDGQRAAEWGHWEGRWRAPARVTRRSGEYLAVWVPTHDGWRLRSESFVALGCEGPGC